MLALTLLSLSCLSTPPVAQPSSERSAAELMDAVMWNREPIGGPFALTDQNGTRRTDVDFRGKLMLVYFGFTYCPDVCPTDLLQIALAVDQLGEAGEMVQPVFITVDPERDTPEHLKEYMALFHPRFAALPAMRWRSRRRAPIGCITRRSNGATGPITRSTILPSSI